MMSNAYSARGRQVCRKDSAFLQMLVVALEREQVFVYPFHLVRRAYLSREIHRCCLDPQSVYSGVEHFLTRRGLFGRFEAKYRPDQKQNQCSLS